jgi:hypothetical protein
VHTDVNDPYMPTWVKTIWWPGETARYNEEKEKEN